VRILDRCNLRQEERKEWMELHAKGLRSSRHSSAPRPTVWLIYFDVSVEECQWRLSKRTDHPTIKSPQSAQRILSAMRDSLEVPSQATERFQKLFTVSGAEEANRLLREWGVPDHLLPTEGSASAGDGDGDGGDSSCKIIKFPRTRHVFNLGSATRDDLILSGDDVITQFGQGKLLYVEEKIDGANLGISIQNNALVAQNRSHYVSSAYHPQFKYLDQWIYDHSHELWEILQYSDRFILYGEWVYARHSIRYTHLPDYFIAFDYYDRVTQRFYSHARLSALLKGTSIHRIRLMACQALDLTGSGSGGGVMELVHRKSEYYDGPVEGVYLRTMTADNQWLLDRGKVVRSDFMAGNEFWSKGGVQPNQIDHQRREAERGAGA
jgi:atypical dual specificity phosphatase